ncbi:MAG: helix-hairpin-helix domain-containing protein [Pirellulaceae bacterium]|nr:helix-hairpin-helix domain-containing protein [Planctomycetales bacterium]
MLSNKEQQLIASAVLGLFATMLVWGQIHRWRDGAWVDYDTATGPPIEFSVNINTADWPELTLLPDVGETLARRIVAYRQEHGPFGELAELQGVPGIGPKLVSKISPYLLTPGGEHVEVGVGAQGVASDIQD